MIPGMRRYNATWVKRTNPNLPINDSIEGQTTKWYRHSDNMEKAHCTLLVARDLKMMAPLVVVERNLLKVKHHQQSQHRDVGLGF